MRHMLKIFVVGVIVTFWAGLALAQGYRVQSGDRLTIEVLEDSSLNRTVIVLPDGRFSFPFAGSLEARGQTIGDIQSSITTAIAPNFATPPTVFVSVTPAPRAPVTATQTEAETIAVYFLGEMNNPGVANVAPGTTLLQAIAVGGGLSQFAAIKRIQLRRTDPVSGVQQVIKLNYKALADGAVANDIELKDGDVILVPERRLFE